MKVLFKKSLMLSLVLITFGGTTFISQPLTASAKKLTLNLIEKHYMKEYKIRVKKTKRANIVKYYKHGGLYVAGHVTIHNGETVRTWFRGVGGVSWQVTGGKHEKYTSKNKEYSVNWTNTNQFKILYTYPESKGWF
ncbi:hypothetical protein FD42_GL001153 [Lentilactobacillus hilgardii DSM 20176 = ATCC 8290]|nr:hypothetical protein FD42_GL001153 [Lentilactobacillus hilgardii DSM 20176 = ATCC 8290]